MTRGAVTLIKIALFGALATLTPAAVASGSSSTNPPTTTLTTAYASAQLGHLNLTSAILFGADGVRFLAGWSSPVTSCRASRHVVIDATLTYSASSSSPGPTTARRWQRAGAVTNCAEGGPSFALVVTASRNGTACRDGRWPSGEYTLSATAIITAPNASTPDATLRAVADLTTTLNSSCA